MQCEDYPCCGHGPPPLGDGGGCPTQYADGTERWPCAQCGVLMPVGHPTAICEGCHERAARRDDEERQGYFLEDE